MSDPWSVDEPDDEGDEAVSVDRDDPDKPGAGSSGAGDPPAADGVDDGDSATSEAADGLDAVDADNRGDTATSNGDADDGRGDSGPSSLAARFVAAVPYAVGIACLAAGVAILVRPSLVPPGVAAQVEGATDAAGTPYLVLGSLVALVVLAVATFGSRADVQRAIGDVTPPEPADRPTARRSGRSIDRRLAALRNAGPRRSPGAREETIEHLREVTVESLVTYRGLSRSRARERVERGEWTDRAAVAAVVGGADAPGMPLRYVLLDWLSAEPAVERHVRRTVDELDRLHGEDRA